MKDKLSALLDGDLDERVSGAVLDSMRHEPDLKARWDDYCLIGDVLRGESQGSTGFTARVMAGLELEPTVLRTHGACAGAQGGEKARRSRAFADADCRFGHGRRGGGLGGTHSFVAA